MFRFHNPCVDMMPSWCFICIEGGTHLSGFRSALTRTVNAYGKSNKLFKDAGSNMSGEDIREGLTAVVSVKVPDPQFEGQTKTKLGNGEVEGIVASVVNEELGIVSSPDLKDLRLLGRDYFVFIYIIHSYIIFSFILN